MWVNRDLQAKLAPATAFHQRLFSTVNSCICIVSVRHCSLPFIPSSCVLEKSAIRSIDVAHSSSTNQTSADFPFILLFASTFVCSAFFWGSHVMCQCACSVVILGWCFALCHATSDILVSDSMIFNRCFPTNNLGTGQGSPEGKSWRETSLEDKAAAKSSLEDPL